MKKLMEMIIKLISNEFNHKNLTQTVIWKLGKMIESSEKKLDEVAAEICALEAEIGDGERTQGLETKERFLETVADQLAEVEALRPELIAAYNDHFKVAYTEAPKVSKPRSNKVKELLAKKAAEAAA